DFEGVVGIQVFGARRAYADPGRFAVGGPGVDGAWLYLGNLPEAYLRARALDLAWRKEILLWSVGAAKAHDEHMKEELEAVLTDKTLPSRPFALLVGWRQAPMPTPPEHHDTEWGASESARGLQLRAEIHTALGRLAAALAVELGE